MRPARLAGLALLASAIAGATAGCPGKKTGTGGGTPTPPPGVVWPEIRNEGGSLEKRGDQTVYKDRDGFELAIPPGFTGKLAFVGDDTGPPIPKGSTMKLRMSDGLQPPCVIDVATTAAHPPEALASAETSLGREVFFLAETRETDLEQLVWTATHVPVRKEPHVDVGYWIFTQPERGARGWGSGGEAPGNHERVLRIEGRFPLARIGVCKEALVSVIASTGARKPEADAGPRSPG